MEIRRRKTRVIKIGDRLIGGGHPILVQSMTKTDTRDVGATVSQIKELEKAGCDIVRVAVPDEEAAGKIRQIKEQISIPLVADIHFNWQLALKAIEEGADKIRIGFKVIGSESRTKEILKTAKDRGIPIRIGVNAGSLDDDIRLRYGSGVRAMVESAMRYIKTCEDNNFLDIVLSIKSSDALETIRAYRALAKKIDYPLHLGVTNAGTAWSGTISSAIAIGSLLEQGIGDTIRVSLTGSPLEEVKVGRQILKSLGLRPMGVRIISCPTCGRLEMGEHDFTKLVTELEKFLSFFKRECVVSIIGCAVNGPGESFKADLGIMLIDKKRAVILRNGKVIQKVDITALKDTIKEVLLYGRLLPSS